MPFNCYYGITYLTFQAQLQLARSLRKRRLSKDLTQAGLAERSGVPLPTVRKFEQKGIISLESFLKLLWVLGGLEELVEVLKPTTAHFSSIDEVLKKEPGKI